MDQQSESRESRAKMQEADTLVQKVTNLANPSRPDAVKNTKTQQAQQLKFAITNKNKQELERCIAAMEETAANAQRRLEELEPKSVQLVGLVKFIKEALSKESVGLASTVQLEEDRFTRAQREMAELVNQIEVEKNDIQQSIEKAKNQVFQMDLKLKAIHDGPQPNVIIMSPEEEANIAVEKANLKVLEDKLSRLIEISDNNNEDFNERHKNILQEIESMRILVDETTAQNQAKQDTLAQENKKTQELEKTMKEMEQKLAALREN